ncbi:MAG: TraC family protein [SAR324 cluster bacterium]|uniref:TraC family protein n=1 Tax=SAR324 cluster bacterium TaxID=2024889 RepID=A0A7X9IK46_9DELT|nr:TraC family protein [SAR324 cluster bacterium]
MSINRITRDRLFQDEALFNELLPFARYDKEHNVFVHSDASLWSIYELQPLWLTKVSDAEAFHVCEQLQEMLDSLEPEFSVQFSWITNFDVDSLLKDSLNSYPTSGPAGWMARRWIRMMRNDSHSANLFRRPRNMRLIVAFRYDPPWKPSGILQELFRSIRILLKGELEVSAEERRAEYLQYVNNFRGVVEGKASKLADLGLSPRHLDGQGLINLLYPILNRRSVKAGKFKRGRSSSIPVPIYDETDYLTNQISETPIEHPKNGFIKKDGRVFRTVSMAKPPKVCLPLMIAPLQSTPYENILTVTYSKDSQEKQIKKLDALDTSLGFREITGRGRSNQKIQHQISAIRTAREDLYNNKSQIVRVGVHQTFICQNEDEAQRAASEALATLPQLHGARGMVHEISDLGALINSLPGCYDPSTDGPGWTNFMRSSRGTRLFPLYGNWKGSSGSLMVLPSLWNRELVGFDLYDSNVAPNVLISGVSGAGKSYLLCYLLIMLNRGHYSRLASGRIAERPPITFVFDKGMAGQPCGFEKVAKLFGGRIYEATPAKAPAMNFLARLGETPADARNEDYKDLLDMCVDIICDMASEGNRVVDRLERGSVIESLVEAHRLYRNGPMKREFVLSDVVSVMRAPRRVDETEDSSLRRQKISLLIADYYGDGTYARFFDRPGSLKLKERFIVFDLKALSRNPDLQRVFLKVAMLWADTVMNDPNEIDNRKVLVFDEAHDLIGKTSAATIETAFRLYRKRKGIVIAASQSGEDFYVGQGGQAIVQNSAHKIFIRQDPSKFHLTSQAFNLSEQQSDVILRLKTVKGVESQFYLLSDIGEAALVLPLEPAFYWASTNNGDDNQLFNDLLAQSGGNFWLALERAVQVAPNGASSLVKESANVVSQTLGGDTVSN